MARILIVDDSTTARKVLCDIVTSLGHVVAGEAGNGMQALQEYERLRPEAVTMDLSMDGIDGAWAISEIVALYPEARILVVSARQDKKEIADAFARGARHFITKPVYPEMLAEALEIVLQQPGDETQRPEQTEESVKKEKTVLPAKNVEFPDASKQINAKVLIVDDSAVARKQLRDIISSLGYVIAGEATNGAQAFVEYIKLKPDIVTMDLTMRGLGGAETTSKIIAADPAARIIIVSATEARQGIIDALERGARHFIVKPIQQDKLAEVLNNVMQQEFDLNKHIESVRKLKELKTTRAMLGDMDDIAPPYEISPDNGLVHVIINQSITPVSFQSLLLEMEEFGGNTTKILLDFGTISSLDQEVLVNFNDYIKDIENNSGLVRAISRNKRFVEAVAEEIEVSLSFLVDCLQYYER